MRSYGQANLIPILLYLPISCCHTDEDLEALTLLSFEPEFVRPPPPVLEVAETELIWLNPDYAPKLQWDTAMCQVQDSRVHADLMGWNVHGSFCFLIC